MESYSASGGTDVESEQVYVRRIPDHIIVFCWLPEMALSGIVQRSGRIVRGPSSRLNPGPRALSHKRG